MFVVYNTIAAFHMAHCPGPNVIDGSTSKIVYMFIQSGLGGPTPYKDPSVIALVGYQKNVSKLKGFSLLLWNLDVICLKSKILELINPEPDSSSMNGHSLKHNSLFLMDCLITHLNKLSVFRIDE